MWAHLPDNVAGRSMVVYTAEEYATMWLLIAMSLALCYGLLRPFSDRLQDTSLWAGKALSPPETALANPSGVQAPLVAGWPSNLIFGTACLGVLAVVAGFVYAWWAAIGTVLALGVLTGIAKQTPIAPRVLERYLAILHSHALRRAADYSVKGDTMRAEAARDLAIELEDLLTTYLGSGVPAPSSQLAKSAPFGEREFLMNQLKSR
jgi:hypothetical protein